MNLITGANLGFTKKLIRELKDQGKNKDYLLVYPNRNLFDFEFLNEYKNFRPFECDLANEENVAELLYYLKDKKISSLVHSNHFYFEDKRDENINDENEISFKNYKQMLEINIKQPMLLNTKLLKENLFELDSKVIHLTFENFDKNNNNLNLERIFNQNLKYLVKCHLDTLKKNPIFFGIIKSKIADRSFYEQNPSNSNPHQKYNEEEEQKTIELISKLLSDNLNPIELSKQVWSTSTKIKI